MTSLSPADAERLQLAFQSCREMEGTLNEQLQTYAAAGREIFPAYGEAEDIDQFLSVVADEMRADDAVGRPVNDDLGPRDGFGVGLG